MKFGVEIEALDRLDRGHYFVCDVLARAGVSAKTARYGAATARHWKVQPDRSVGSSGFEVVSPVLESTKPAHVETLRNVFAALSATPDFYTGNTCGFHVHVSAEGMELPAFKALCKYFVKYESAFDELVAPGRRDSINTYCRSNSMMITGQRGKPEPAALKAAFQKIDSAATLQQLAAMMQSEYTGSTSASRYYKLNLLAHAKHGTVEFRQFQGTIDPERAIAWTMLCLAVMENAQKNAMARFKVAGAGALENLVALVPDKAARKTLRGFVNAHVAAQEPPRRAAPLPESSPFTVNMNAVRDAQTATRPRTVREQLAAIRTNPNPEQGQ